MRAPPLVLLDANILYSRLLRELFMELHLRGLIHARWTDDIHDEWIRSVLSDYPDINPTVLKKTRELMNLHAEGSLVTDYQDYIQKLLLPDPNDRHILAAAISGEIPTILTFNINDFPATSLSEFDIEAKHPDVLLFQLFEAHPHDTIKILKYVRNRMKNPLLDQKEFTSRLSKAGLTSFADRLLEFVDQL
jgi:hypothetical protein